VTEVVAPLAVEPPAAVTANPGQLAAGHRQDRDPEHHAGRHLRGVGPWVAAQQQSLDELRHIQTQIHTISHYGCDSNRCGVGSV